MLTAVFSFFATVPLGNIEGVGVLGNLPRSGTTSTSTFLKLETLVSNIIGALTIIGGIWFIIQVMLAAISWISAGGDKALVETARKKLTNSIIGLFFVTIAMVLTSIVGRFLGLPGIFELAYSLANLQP
jgi:hypothetical protein